MLNKKNNLMSTLKTHLHQQIFGRNSIKSRKNIYGRNQEEASQRGFLHEIREQQIKQSQFGIK